MDDMVKRFANLANLIEPMKSFRWGRDVSTANMHQGFTHVSESIFESMDDVETYSAHPAHLQFADHVMTLTYAILVLDYKPTLDLRIEVVAGVSEQELRVVNFIGLASIVDKRWALFDVAANDLDTFFAYYRVQRLLLQKYHHFYTEGRKLYPQPTRALKFLHYGSNIPIIHQNIGTTMGDIGIWEVGSWEKLVLNNSKVNYLNAVSISQQIQSISFTGFPAQSVGSSNTDVLDSPCLLVLITGTSQSRQHGKSESDSYYLSD
ncbi:stress-response A/B barrel domain-containing protein HS1 [Tanacetum coccineum]|uniref:Stress-response A/B barrel domain-containing protein HS1 n=1 Tax=Tanacetum coccineum TaxID=301880 RepID=A0ABQ5B0N9_9ASTR